MFVGIGPEAGKRVREIDAFSYACERCLTGTREEQENFLKLARENADLIDFATELVEWFYSGNWVNETPTGQNTGYIIRFENNELLGTFGTYLEAIRKGREEAGKRGFSFVVN